MYEFSLLDLFPYIFLSALLLLLKDARGDMKKRLFYCFLATFVFAAIRYGIGWDYYGYMHAAQHDVDDVRLDHNEPLARVIIDIAFNTHYQVFFVISTFITLFPVYYASKELSNNPILSYLIFFFFPIYYLESLSIVRNAMAYSVFLLSFVCWNKEKKLLSVVIMAVAVLLHKSAIVGFLLFPLCIIKNKRDIHLALFILSFLLTPIVMRVVGSYSSVIPLLMNIENYAEKARDGGGTMTYILNFLCVFHLIIWNKLSPLNKNNHIYLGAFSVGVFFWNIFLHVDSTLSLRFSSFFMIFIIFLVPQYKYAFHVKYRKMISQLSLSFFILVFIAYFYININGYMQNRERMSNLPYQTIFYHRDYSNYLY